MHDAITVGVPLVAILAGILLNRSDVKDLRGEIRDVPAEIKDVRAEIKELRGEMNARFNAVDAELRYFHGVTGKLDGRIESLEKR